MTRLPVAGVRLVMPITHVVVRGKDRHTLATLAVVVPMGISFPIMIAMCPQRISMASVGDSLIQYLFVDAEVDVETASLFKLELADVVRLAHLITQVTRPQVFALHGVCYAPVKL